MLKNGVLGRAAVGAWIEITIAVSLSGKRLVAPLAEGELKKVNLELLVSSNALM